MKYITGFFSYLWLVTHRAEFICGLLIGVFFVILAAFLPMGVELAARATLVITIVAFFIAAYDLYRKERTVRSELEERLTITAKIGSLSSNFPDPGPDKISLRVFVVWEIWVTEDVATDRIALNLIYEYDRPRWKFWKKRRFPITGIPPKQTGTTQYRHKLSTAMPMPFTDSAEFEYVAERESASDPHWLLELVIETGVPRKKYRAPVFIDWDERHRRGTNPPL